MTDEEIQKGILYPSISRRLLLKNLLRDCDVGAKELMHMSKEETVEYVAHNMWYPIYSPLVHEK